MGSDNRRLPVQFLAAVAALAETGSPAATFAAAQAQGMTDGLDQERLLSGLLSGPFKDCAPAWMLQIAIEQGLKSSETYRAEMAIDLAALALSHPDSAGELRSAAVRSCTNVQLANLGLAERPDVLVEAVAAELHRRSAPPEPMTVKLLEVPTPAQVVMRTEGLADVVFDAAFKLLPRRPEPTQAGDRGPSQRFFDELDAWEAMWEDILKTHPERHAAIVEHVAEQPASGPIRHCLIGKLPWMVEPELLKSLALEHLDRFQTVLLITHAGRMLRSGDSKSAVRDSIASDL